jgi:cytoskeletal protein CcmA (bactofilin family)
MRRAGACVFGGYVVSEQNSALPAALSIPRQAYIEGAIEYSGPMIIAGTIEGDVTCTSLIVTERGIINGSVRSDSVTVLGEINGEIYANTLTLKTASSVSGDIFHNHLVLEDGAYFEGKSRRMIVPLELAL